MTTTLNDAPAQVASAPRLTLRRRLATLLEQAGARRADESGLARPIAAHRGSRSASTVVLQLNLSGTDLR